MEDLLPFSGNIVTFLVEESSQNSGKKLVEEMLLNSGWIVIHPKKLLQNYHRLNKLYKDTDTYTEDEDVNGLTVSAQIKILNDKSMNYEEKKCKLESLWDKTDTRWKMGRQRWSSSSSSSDEEEQEEREWEKMTKL